MAQEDYAPAAQPGDETASSAGTSASGTDFERVTKLLAAGGAFLGVGLFVVAGAANLGFYDAFGIQDLRIVGIDKAAILDHAIVFGVMLVPTIGSTAAFAFVAAAVIKQTSKEGWAPVVADVALVAAILPVGVLVGLPLDLAAFAPAVVVIAFALATLVKGPRIFLASRARPWGFVAAALLVTTLASFGAFRKGNAWGASVRELERTKRPFLSSVLIVQWPRGAAFGDGAELCTEDILLGNRGNTYVLYKPRTGLVHELSSSRLTRTSLRSVRRSECPGLASPASAR